MLGWLWGIIVGNFCAHKWKIIKESRCDGDCGERWTRYYTQCEHCGKIKVFDR